MSLSSFSLHHEDTRLIKHQKCVYKVKVNFSGIPEKISSSLQDAADHDLEQVFRAVLYAEERDRHLALIETDHFLVSYTKKYWKASEKLGFKEDEEHLKVFPYVLMFKVSVKEKIKLIQNQDEGTASKSLSTTRSWCSSQNEASRKTSGTPDGHTQQNKQVAKKTQVSEKRGHEDSIAVPKKASSNIGETSAVDVNQLEKSSEVKSKNNNNIQGQKTTTRSNNLVKSNTLTTNPVRRSHRLLQNNTRQNQSDALQLETTTVNKVQNVTEHRQTKFHSVKKIPVSDNLNLKRKKAKSISPVRVSVRQMWLRNCNNNSHLPMDGVEQRQVVRSSRHDRHLIESEEYAENLKLQSLASSKSPKRSPRKRRRSGLWEFVETIATPIKRLFTGN